MRINKLSKELIFSLLFPVLALGTCFLLPVEYFDDCTKLMFWPIENLLADNETKRELTLLVFGRATPNYAPIQILLYMLFWPVVLFAFIRISGALRKHLTKK